MADLTPHGKRGGRERERERSSMIVQTLVSQRKVRARQDRARLYWAWVVKYKIFGGAHRST